MPQCVFIHFRPLEKYPPAMNWLEYVARQDNTCEWKVFSTSNAGNNMSAYKAPAPFIRIFRTPAITGLENLFYRMFCYSQFFIRTFLYLLIRRPETVLYFETISSLPATLYKRYFNKKARLFIHYHEYNTPEEYKKGMKLTRYFYKLEKAIYRKAEWISHTHPNRIEDFLKDHAHLSLSNTHILPNFPPLAWKKEVKPRNIDGPLKLVSVGSVGMQDLYLEEICNYVESKKGAVTLDFYTHTITVGARTYFDDLKCPWISFLGSIDYQQLPDVLGAYDVGLILYRSKRPNVVNCAPNKLFEYLACGLDVWITKELKGSYPFLTEGSYPQVLLLDFSTINDIDLKQLARSARLTCKPSVYYMEKVLSELFNSIVKG